MVHGKYINRVLLIAMRDINPEFRGVSNLIYNKICLFPSKCVDTQKRRKSKLSNKHVLAIS